MIHDAFPKFDSGESLTLINDNDSEPLFHEMQTEVDDATPNGTRSNNGT